MKIIVLTSFLFLTPSLHLLMAQHLCANQKGNIERGARDAESSALDTRSDSIDIRHYTINLDFTSLPQATLIAACTVDFEARVNGINQLVLDLEALTVDSIKAENELLTFTHTGPKLRINLSQNLNQGDISALTVYYGGTPIEDASGFGGFSFSGSYAYNIGVGFSANPHNLGRVWFPCFDNFVERSTYTCIVNMPPTYSAYCGGMLVSDETNGNVRTMVWDLNQEIPTYLASVAVAPYTEVRKTFNSITNPSLPVVLAALPADTTALKNSFVSLEPIFEEFEAHFGPYRWDRVGYVLVPFQAGAMEHASNVAFMRDLIPFGPSQNQHIMAHELAHSWFGNLATCRTASEMWLNEGWASYTERLFDEWIISRATYDAKVRDNHKEMLQLAHVRDSAYWPLSNVPHAYTYSNHTYELPADKIHTLRSYMGDSLFFAGLRHYLETHQYTHATSNDLRDALQEATELDLNDYFADWVDTPGWAGFEIDSSTYSGGVLNVYYSQKSAGNTHHYQNVPMSFSFVRNDFSAESSMAFLSGPNGMVTFDLDFEPEMVILNRDEKISQAVTGQEAVITSTGTRVWSNALVEIPVDAIGDSVLLRVEHFWVAPDPIKTPYMPYRLSPNRYWKVDGILNSGFRGKFRVQYNGKTNTTDNGWLDHNLITDENRLVLMYRRDAHDDWRVIPSTKNMYTSTTDKFGKIETDTLMLGEYLLAELDSSLGSVNLPAKNLIKELIITPNPATEEITISWNDNHLGSIELFDAMGKNIGYTQPLRGIQSVTLPISHLGKGHYIIRRTLGNGEISLGKFIKVE